MYKHSLILIFIQHVYTLATFYKNFNSYSTKLAKKILREAFDKFVDSSKTINIVS